MSLALVITARDALIAVREDLSRNGWSKRAERCLYGALCRAVPDVLWSTVGRDTAAWLTWYLGESIVSWNDRQTDAAEVLRILDGAILLIGGP